MTNVITSESDQSIDYPRHSGSHILTNSQRLALGMDPSAHSLTTLSLSSKRCANTVTQHHCLHHHCHHRYRHHLHHDLYYCPLLSVSGRVCHPNGQTVEQTTQPFYCHDGQYRRLCPPNQISSLLLTTKTKPCAESSSSGPLLGLLLLHYLSNICVLSTFIIKSRIRASIFGQLSKANSKSCSVMSDVSSHCRYFLPITFRISMILLLLLSLVNGSMSSTMPPLLSGQHSHHAAAADDQNNLSPELEHDALSSPSPPMQPLQHHHQHSNHHHQSNIEDFKLGTKLDSAVSNVLAKLSPSIDLHSPPTITNKNTAAEDRDLFDQLVPVETNQASDNQLNAGQDSDDLDEDIDQLPSPPSSSTMSSASKSLPPEESKSGNHKMPITADSNLILHSNVNDNVIGHIGHELSSTPVSTISISTTPLQSGGGSSVEHPISFDFTKPIYNVSIPENSPSKVYATSTEKMGIYISDPALSVRFKIVAGDVDKIFRADLKHVGNFFFLLIRVRHGSNAVLNREYRSSYELRVRASITSEQNKQIRFKSKCNVSVTVLDRNDISPIFFDDPYNVDVQEDVPLDTQIARVTADDPDIGLNGEIYYSLAEESHYFAIHPTMGIIYTTRSLNLQDLLSIGDNEQKPQHNFVIHLNVLAKDRGFHQSSSPTIESSKARVNIRILPVNRHSPQISIKQHSTLSTTLPTEQDSNQRRPIYAVIHVSDSDLGIYGEICSFDIISGNEQGFFAITNLTSSRDYNVELAKSINDLFSLTYTLPFELVVQATDCGGLSSNDTIQISLDSQLNLSFKFTSDNYYREVHESSLIGTQVIQVDLKLMYDSERQFSTSSHDKVGKDTFHFSIISGNTNETFGISRNGVVYTRSRLDRELVSKYVLVVQAQHKLNQIATTQVHIEILDDNDNFPVFKNANSNGVVELEVNENKPNGSVIFHAQSIDLDLGNNGLVTYELVHYRNDEQFPFAIDAYTGDVLIVKPLDYEMLPRNYLLFVRASDWGEPFRRQSQLLLNVSVVDVNDHRPKFEKLNCTAYVPINSKPFTEIMKLSAIDLDEGSEVLYKMFSPEADRCFRLNEVTGQLELTCNLKKEIKTPKHNQVSWTLSMSATDGHYFSDTNYVRIVVVEDSGNFVRDKRASKRKVDVECSDSDIRHKLKHHQRIAAAIVLSSALLPEEKEALELMRSADTNHDTPKFDISSMDALSIPEDTPVNSKITTFVANDTDTGFDGLLIWSLNLQEVENNNFYADKVYFEIDPHTGELYLISGLDFEEEEQIELLVTVCDQSVRHQKCANRTIKVSVEDINDNSPQMGNYVFTVSEAAPPQSVIGTIHATDRDSGDNSILEYYIASHADMFSIDLFNGTLRLEKALDRETTEKYTVYVTVSDSGSPSLSSTSVITIKVDDVNDNSPQFFQKSYFLKVREDIPIGTRLTRISAFDRDEGKASEIRYSLLDTEKSTFEIDDLTGNIRLKSSLDYEKIQIYNLSIVASDSGKPSLSTSTYLIVEVEDVNENYHAPKFEDIYATASVKENMPAGTLVTQVTAVDEDNPTLPLIYQIIGGNGLGRFSIDSNGNVYTSTILDRETNADFWLTIVAKDGAAVPLTSYLELYISVEDVNDMPPITTESFYSAKVYENVSVGTTILKLEAHDQDFRLSKDKSPISFRITNTVPFEIDSTGEIKTTGPLDAEEISRYVLDVEVMESAAANTSEASSENQAQLISRTPVILNVMDVNEFEPKSILHTYRCFTFSKVDMTLPVCHIIAYDHDKDDQCSISYELIEGNEKKYFKVDPSSGIIYSAVPYLPKGSYDFIVKISDCGQPEPLSSTVHVIIRVLSVEPKEDNHKPMIEPIDSTFLVDSNHEVGHTVTWIKAMDDDYDRLCFYILSGNVDNSFAFLDTGALVIAKSLRNQFVSQFNLKLMITDGIDNTTFPISINVLNDVDEVTPFSQDSHTVNVLENITIGSDILQLNVIENDLTSSDTIFLIYSTQSPDTLTKFEIESWSGKIRVKSSLDFESGKQHVLLIQARNARKHTISYHNRSFTKVIINVIDVNDQTPQFIMPYFETNVLETASLGTSVLQVQAFDGDFGINAKINYSIVSGNIDNVFDIEPNLGYIFLSKQLSFREQPHYYLLVKATDNGEPPLSSTANVHVLVSIPDNSPPKFEQDNYLVDIREDEKIGTVLLSMRMSSKQSTFFEITRGNEDNMFGINVNNGEVYLRKRLDFERANNYTLTVSAVSLFAVNDTAKIFITVIDINDNAPYWNQTLFEGQVFETTPVNSVVLTEDGQPLVIQAYDKDSMHNAILLYAIVEEKAREYFKIEPRTGAISLIKKLDYEKSQEFIFSVSVTDHGFPSLKSLTNAAVRIKCLPVNDCAPVFSLNKFRATLMLPTFSNVIITKVSATDCDFKPDKGRLEQNDLTFSLSSVKDDSGEISLFKINSTTGQITTTTDQIEPNVYEMTVSAFDGKFTTDALVIINAKPIPRSSLRFRHERFYGTITENSTSMHVVVMPTIDGNKLHEHLIFRIMNPTNHFKIARTSGAILFRGLPVDREQVSKIELAIEVQSISQKHRVAHALVEIQIEDINDNRPIFVSLPYHFVFNSDSSAGESIGKIQAVDMDSGPNGQVSYSIVSGDPSNLFALNSQTGQLTLARSVNMLNDSINYVLLVMAKDLGVPPLESYTNVTLRMVSGGVPVFAKPHYNVTVNEIHAAMVPFITLKAESPHGRQIFYNIEAGNENDEFALDFNTGMVSIAEKLDRETVSQYNLLVSATDSISGASSTVNLYINVEDANDNQPMFNKLTYNVTVPENLAIGSMILKVEATDVDIGLNARLEYQIEGNKTHFYMSPDDGIIYLKSALDHETEDKHHFTIMVTDHGSPQLTSTAQVWVIVTDVNDNAPTLPPSFTTFIDEDINKGGFVAKVTANDADWSDRSKLRYRILSGSDMAFYINETSGSIYVRNLKNSRYLYHHHSTHPEQANHLVKWQYNLNVSVSDGVFSTTEMYPVHIKPANHYSPRFKRILNNVAVREGAALGSHVFTINATDRDQGLYGEIEYQIMNDYGRKFFSIQPQNGVITLKSELDYEKGDKFFWLILGAQDKGKRLGVSTVRVAVIDDNDNVPRFIVDEYKATVCSNAHLDSAILLVLAIDDDKDAENILINYSIYEDKKNETGILDASNSTISYINEYFEISSDTGYIYTRKNLSSLVGKTVQFFVKASNANIDRKNSKDIIENIVPVTIQVTNSCPYRKKDSSLYEVFVTENVVRGSIVANLNLDSYKDVELSIVGLDDKADISKFRIDKYGKIYVNAPLFREVKSRHILAIQLKDKLTFVADYFYVIINIMDQNDCTPYFDSSSYHLTLAENQETGSSIFKVNAIDNDIDLLSNSLKFSIKDNYVDTFVIDENSGWISLNKKLDREQVERYNLQVFVSDGVHVNSTWLHVDVFDVNDNAPIVDRPNYIAAIFENSLLGTVITRVDAKDMDVNPELRYFITEGDYLNQFDISSVGDIYVNKPLDREFIDQYKIKILVTDGKYQTETQVVIDILDINDNGPVCVKSKYVEMVSEAVSPGTYILTVEAVDHDDVENSKLYFTLAGDHKDHFFIDQFSGRLKTNAKLDRETQASYLFDVVVYDDKNRDWHCTSHVEILLRDVNDEPPKFLSQINSVNIPEDSPVGIILGKVTAIDLDLGLNRQIRYELVNPSGEFVIGEKTGIIRLAQSLDRELQSLYNVSIMAFDSGSIKLNSTTYFVVIVTDINDNAPEFQMQSYKAQVDENSNIGTELIKIFATSKDTGINAEITYQISGGNDNETFTIDEKSGIVTVSRELDYENIKEYFLTIKAQDKGIPPLSSEVSLVVTVNDINDVRPQFVQRSYDIVIREDAQVGDRILQLVAIDLDSAPNANLTYSFGSGILSYKEFQIDPKLGILTVGQPLDREMMSSYILEVFCSDNGKPKALFSSVLINVEISDYNDNPPLFDKINQTIHVQEGRPVGYILLQFMIQDADSSMNSGPFKFQIEEGNRDNSFVIMDSDASLRTNKIFAYSNQSEYRLKIRVTDSGNPPLHSINWVTVSIIQEPQMPPKLQPLSIIVNSLEQFPGGIIGYVNASDEDRFDKLTYSLTNDDDKNIFSIDPNEGTLLALPGLDVGKYKLNITVTDGRFLSYGTVDVDVALITETMVEHSMVIEFRSISDKEFVTSYMKNFVRIIKNLFNVRSKDVTILSIQPAERKSLRRHRSDEVVFGDISIMFTVAITKGGYFTRNWLKAKLMENKFMIENQLGLSFEEVLLKSQCEHIRCKHGECREDLMLSESEISSIISSKVSFVSPFHEYRFGCACHAGFGGKVCNITVNECSRNPCPPHKECLPVSSSLGYVCQCPFGKSGPSCNQNAETCHSNERDVSFCYPEFNPISFNGNSYLRYAFVKKIDKISLRFRGQQLRARIFTQQDESSFNILEIIGGYIQYRFDCGEGEGLIRVHNLMVNDGKWHEIIVERKGSTALLTLDRKYKGGGFAPGTTNSCNRLKEDIYFGGQVKSISQTVGDEEILNGFIGCLDNILFNSQQIPFHMASKSSVVILKTLANVEFSCNFKPDTGACKSQPCLNGGLCNNLANGSYTCSCVGPRYTGKQCEIDTNPCESSPCLNEGICVTDDKMCQQGLPNCYKCECRPGFTGTNCQLSRYCTHNLCQNGGVCEQTNLGPKCHCHTGWHGQFCQEDVDECQISTPACFTPATCINLPGTFRCICPINSTVPCNGDGLIPSNVVSSQFHITLEEMVVFAVILLVLILFGCFLVLCWSRKNRKTKNRAGNLKNDANELLLKNRPTPTYDNLTNYRVSKTSNLEMSNMVNNVFLSQQRTTSYNENFNNFNLGPNSDDFEPHTASATVFDHQPSYHKKSAPVASVSPQLIENKNSPKNNLKYDKPRSKNSMTDLNKETPKKRISLNDSADSNVFNDEQPPSLTNSNQAEGYHWDNLDLNLTEHCTPATSNFVELNDGESVSELSQMDVNSDSQKLIYQNVGLIIRNGKGPNESLGDESSPLLLSPNNSASNNTTARNSTDSNVAPSPSLDVKLGAKLGSKNCISRYLPSYDMYDEYNMNNCKRKNILTYRLDEQHEDGTKVANSAMNGRRKSNGHDSSSSGHSKPTTMLTFNPATRHDDSADNCSLMTPSSSTSTMPMGALVTSSSGSDGTADQCSSSMSSSSHTDSKVSPVNLYANGDFRSGYYNGNSTSATITVTNNHNNNNNSHYNGYQNNNNGNHNVNNNNNHTNNNNNTSHNGHMSSFGYANGKRPQSQQAEYSNVLNNNVHFGNGTVTKEVRPSGKSAYYQPQCQQQQPVSDGSPTSNTNNSVREDKSKLSSTQTTYV